MEGSSNKKNILGSFILSTNLEDQGEVIPIISDSDDYEILPEETPKTLSILPLRNNVLFPGVIMPISVGRPKSLKLIREASMGNKFLGTVAQRNGHNDHPDEKDLYKYGTVAKIIKVLDMPDGSTSVIIQGKIRFSLDKVIEESPYMRASITPMADIKPKKTKEFSAVVASLKDLSLKLNSIAEGVPSNAHFAVKNIDNDSLLINFVSNNTEELEVAEKQELLECNDIKSRGTKLLTLLLREVQMLELKKDIQQKVRTDMDQQQKEYLLQQQIKTIQDELGGNPIEQEILELKERGKNKKWSDDIKIFFEKETSKLSRMNPAAGEYSVQVGYIETLLELPWKEFTKDNFDLKNAQEILDRDHYGLEKVKDRMLEHLSVLKLKGDMKSPILCLYGPPGVGKTSLGKSVAKALGRKYVRISLGGLHDESEIRGHRKTYIGAMPGRIIQSLKRAGSSNPVFILDEVDKVSKDFHGDPASALLEVLDPEQNSEFHDNYLEVDYDLSKVMFIATANTLNTIHPALCDRMELIDVSGYLVEEKIEIANRHLIPTQLKNHGLKKSHLSFSKGTITKIIEQYTQESGVRELNKQIAKLLRRVARKIAFGDKYNKNVTVKDVREYLGVPAYMREVYEGNEYAGVVTGLAWTAVGGEILYVETSLTGGKGKLTLTGNLGDVMKESATIAFEYIKAHSYTLGIQYDVFEKWDVHIHVPEGAIPKDGPSAGITMITSLASAFTQRKVKKGMAMTGEVTLRGKILPVGGIKEKILAAKRAGIKEVILSKLNKKDLEDIKPIYVKGLKIHFVENATDVFNIALLSNKVSNPLKIN